MYPAASAIQIISATGEVKSVDKNYCFNRNQLLALCSVTLLVPALRLVPSLTANLGGRAAWLAVPVASILPLLAYIFFIGRFMSRRERGEGMAELIMRCLGDGTGHAALIIFALWMLLYAGFILRSGAERMVTMIYPDSSPVVFSVLTGLISVIAALGPARSLMRFAKLVQPVVLGTLGLFMLFALTSVDYKNLVPVTFSDTVPTLYASLPIIDAVGVVLCFSCFLEGECENQPQRFKSYALWLIPMLVIFMLLSITVIGRFGAELTALLTFPFFTLVRNLVFFNALERLEALIVSLWLFPDFLLVSALLYSSQQCLRCAMGKKAEYSGERRFDLSRGRWVIPICGVLSITAAILIAPDAASMTQWSERTVPIMNLAISFALVPLIYIIGKLRKKI